MPFPFQLDEKLLEISAKAEEEVPAKAIIWVTASCTEQAIRRLAVKQVRHTSIKAEVITNVKTKTDVMIENVRQPFLICWNSVSVVGLDVDQGA